jgi:ribosomal-protein-serine acetyltransferase
MPTKPTVLSEMLVSRRLALRRHTIDLAALIFHSVDRDRERLEEFLPWPPLLRSINQEQEYLLRSRKAWEAGETFDFGIYAANDNSFMGCIGTHTIRWAHDCAEIGFWILKEYEGRGFISEALQVLEKELFQIGLHRIEIRCDTTNIRSANVARNAGYTLDGVLKENVFERGRYRDTMVWGKIRR